MRSRSLRRPLALEPVTSRPSQAQADSCCKTRPVHTPSVPGAASVSPAAVSRRSFLAAAAALGTVGITGLTPDGAWALPLQPLEPPPIADRATWAWDLPPTSIIPAEDVRFLLVHHTLQPANDYGADDVVDILRGIYRFHTGPDKGWPDIAYNFMVDRFGRIFEARSGSLTGPVQGSATGGNQGFSQLCCFLGDHSSEPPSEEAQASMIWLLAWLANRYEISLEPGATAGFVSRGSNRWPVGTEVTTATIAGHRDMSMTECPGNACYELLDTRFRPDAELAVRSTVSPTTTAVSTATATSTTSTSTSLSSSTTAESTTTDTERQTTAAATSNDDAGLATSTTAVDATDPEVAQPPLDTRPRSPAVSNTLAVLGIGTVVAAGSALAIRRRTRPPHPEDPSPQQ